jgi:hypothetical protein
MATASNSIGSSIKTVKVWMKAFIPVDLDGVETVKSGSHAGKTALSAPGPIQAWFLTDQRQFSSDISASARMHSEVEIDVERQVVSREFHHCDASIEVDLDSGEEICREAAHTDNMAFSNFQVLNGGNRFSIDLKASSKNPCLKIASVEISPNLDYIGSITVTRVEASEKVIVTFEGDIETYPAFEMYVSVNGGDAQAVFTVGVVPETSPLNLVGPPARPAAYQVVASG